MTPTLNAASYLRRALESVRDQTYPSVEHLVVDGGSSDGTLAIAAEFAGVRTIGEPGRRQSEAVNLGVHQARGDIIVVLNADDVLEPHAVATLVAALEDAPDSVAAYGQAHHIDDAGNVVATYPTRAFSREGLAEACYICQPASAVRRDAYLAIGGMDPSLDVALDYDFWIRLSQIGDFTAVDDLLAASRMHRGNKTMARRGEMYREVVRVLRAHFDYVPYTWTYGYANWLIERGDQFFTPPRWSKAAVALSLPLGVWLNPQQPRRYLRDWYGHRDRGRH